MAKGARLDEIVGHLKEEKEEEPEGEQLGQSDTGNILLPLFFINFSDQISLFCASFILPPFSLNLSFLDDYEKGSEEGGRLLTKEEEDIDILCS